ncbi:MAG: DUF6779 domain-containing protein [Dietzia sp.]
MSSDGAMDKPRSARPARGDDRGLASIALVVLLVLALIATVVMIFSDNPVWMRIGTLSALWAAFIGAFLVARYRRQAAAEAARVRDLHTVYELQLEREISARREHELVVEKELRASVRAETEDSVLALRQEIAALREQLSALGVSLPEDRFAVGGPGPAGQLGAGPSLPSVPSERVAPRRRTPGMTPPRVSGRATTDAGAAGEKSAPGRSTPSGPSTRPGQPERPAPSGHPSAPTDPAVAGVGPDATPSTERTERLSPVSGRTTPTQTPAGEPRRPAVRPVQGSQEPRRAPGAGSGDASGATAAPSSATSPRPSRSGSSAAAGSTPTTGTPRPSTPGAPSATGTSSAPSTGTSSAPSSDRAAAPKAGSATDSSTGSAAGSTPAGPAAKSDPAAPSPAQETGSESTPTSRHGEGRGLSVAELMARLGEGDAPKPSRRRRRAED